MTSISASNLLALRNQILQQNSALQKASAGSTQTDFADIASLAGSGSGTAAAGAATSAPQSLDFTSALKDAIGKVSDLQGKADDASVAYEKGDTTDIAAVMLAREQSSVGFQATLQVRNKLLSAYKDIMSMPV